MNELSDYDRETLDRIARSCVNGEDDIEARVRAVIEARDAAEAKIAEALHECWLAVHVHRFDKQDGETAKPDCFYAGVIHSEHQITEVAARYGVDPQTLRNPSSAVSS